MNANLIILIKDYMKLAEEATRLLCSQARTANILAAVNSGGFPRKGDFHGFGGGSYFIHGCGCEISTPELDLDFDFGPESRISGFDPWKLYNFANDHAEAYPWLPKRNDFEKLINLHIKSGVLIRSNESPSPHLLCVHTCS